MLKTEERFTINFPAFPGHSCSLQDHVRPVAQKSPR